MTINEHDPGTELVSYDGPVDERREPQDADMPRWVRHLPDFMIEPRLSLVQWLRESARPEPGQTETVGWRLAWTRLVALPIRVVARMWEEAGEKPERLIPALLLLVVLATTLNQVPIVRYLVADQLDFTSWF